MTLGEHRVRSDFNPSGNPLVNEFKEKTAELIDRCETPGMDPRLAALAQTSYEQAAMWAMKAATAQGPLGPPQGKAKWEPPPNLNNIGIKEVLDHVFLCESCRGSMETLVEHISGRSQDATGDFRGTCICCDVGFKSREALQAHNELIHPGNPQQASHDLLKCPEPHRHSDGSVCYL